MSDIKIKKAKIKDDLFLEGEYTEQLPGHSKKDSKYTCTVPVHQDLKDAFSKLDKHLAILCDQVELPAKVKVLDDWSTESMSKFEVKGFTITGSDDNEGCTLSGSMDGKYGFVNLNTPIHKWESSEYKFINTLSADIEACIYEVHQYLFEGKRAPEKQLEMDFDEEDKLVEEDV